MPEVGYVIFRAQWKIKILNKQGSLFIKQEKGANKGGKI